MGPGDLQALLGSLHRSDDPAILVGTETGDDAGVLRLDGERAIVVTADFITPVADDPFRYGQIAAANSLSDVFAMGGRALAAVALCAFPKELEPSAAAEILAGGEDKVREAGAHLLGGHTVRNPELFYGLSVTGLVEPARVVRNVGARPGDVLVLTKPIGTGLVINGRRKGLTRDEDLARALASMALLNRVGGEAAGALGAHAGTDVTGFGLVGHALKMAKGSRVTLRFDVARLPILDGAAALAEQGVTTAATKSNRAAGEGHIRFAGGPPSLALDQIVHDPQTAGGLLLALAPAAVEPLLDRVRAAGQTAACVVGEVIARSDEAAPLLEFRGALASSSGA